MVDWFENYDIQNIKTPVDADKLDQLLQEANYNSAKRQYLVEGFRKGFSLHFGGNDRVKRYAPNLKLRVGSKLELWNKVMKEVVAGRYAGPFEEVPYEFFIQSPIGLVPKDQGRKTRLIFHLSYPRTDDTSVNAGIPREKCSVRYPEFEEAVLMCLRLNSEQIFAGKSDISMAFRHVPLKPREFKLLILKAEHPLTKKTWYFVEKCLPFGSSISCAIFQVVSDAIAFLVTSRTNRPTLNYLDDYYFVKVLKLLCNWQVNQFLNVCQEIGFPVALEKTHWGCQFLVFLGFLLDMVNKQVAIPVEKLVKALSMVEEMLNSKKTTVHKIQRLCGVLNFLCRIVIPGRAFTRRLYALTANKEGVALKQYHHVNVKRETKLDLEIWRKFLMNSNLFCRHFFDFGLQQITDIRMYSDASRNFTLGSFGAWCEQSWMQGFWHEEHSTAKY